MAQNNDPAIKLPDDWQQGDTIKVDGLPFMYMSDLRNPLMPATKEFLDNEGQSTSENPYAAIAFDVEGFVVISQTCDLIRDFADVPTVQLATIEKVSPEKLANAKKRTIIRYLFLPALESKSLVANLDQIFTAEKALLLGVSSEHRMPGVRTDGEAQVLSESIARKFNRFAFPEEFTEALDKFRDFVIGKHHKASDNGKVLQSIAEIRVASSKGWADKDSEIHFLFLFENQSDITAKCEISIDDLMKRFVVNESFPVIPAHRCATFEDITADAFRRSQILDLNFVSNRFYQTSK